MKLIKILLCLFFFSLTIIGQPTNLVEIKTEISAPTQIIFQLKVSAGYHITDLKNNFFYVKLASNPWAEIEKVEFPQPIPYKEEMVFKGQVPVKIFLKNKQPLKGNALLDFLISYQLCQEEPMEVCYPPEEQNVQVAIDSSFFPKKPGFSIASFLRKLEEKFKAGKGNLLLLIIITFLAGFLTSLTPCVYPVIPLIIGFLGSREQKSKLHNFYLSLIFALGLSTVYALLGVIAAQTGSLLGVSFQKPVVVIIVALIFMAMGFSLLGLFNIVAPSSAVNSFQKNYKNEIIKSFFFGALAALVAAPCAGPIIVALLSYISQTKSIIRGFLLTFSYAIGLSVIFVLVGTFSNLLSSLPRGGNWMEFFKKTFGFLLIAGGLLILQPILPFSLLNIFSGTFIIFLSLYLKPFTVVENDLKKILRQLFALLLLLCGIFFFLRGLNARFPFLSEAPAISLNRQALSWENDFSIALNKAKAESKLIMIDFSANWCTACQELEELTFSPLKNTISERFIPLKVDLTSGNSAANELQRRFKVVGLPTVIFLTSEQKELARFSGFINAEEFNKIISSL